MNAQLSQITTHTVLIGQGSHGLDIRSIWSAAHPTTPLPGYDDDGAKRTSIKTEAAAADRYAILGVNDPVTRMALEKRFPKAAWQLVHPDALVDDLTKFSRGVVVGPRTYIGPLVALGRHTHVNYGTTMTRCVVGKFVTIAPGVTICGDVNIGDGAFIGAGAVIKNLVKIGKWAKVGAGAVVVKDVPDYATVKGVPAQ